MKVTGIKRAGVRADEVAAAIEVSAAQMENVEAKTEINGNEINFTLRVRDSSGPHARRSPSGRRTTGADFDAHARVLADLFRFAPSVRVETALATYRGYGDFLEKWQAVGRTKVGSGKIFANL